MSSAQPEREFTNQRRWKCRPSSGPAPVSVCLSRNVRAALDQAPFILTDTGTVQNIFGIHPSFVIVCRGRHPTGLQRSVLAGTPNQCQLHKTLLFFPSPCKSKCVCACVWQKKEGREKWSNFLNLPFFIMLFRQSRNFKQALASGFRGLFQSHVTTETENVVKGKRSLAGECSE